jgi:hypothetical protein
VIQERLIEESQYTMEAGQASAFVPMAEHLLFSVTPHNET